MSVGEYLLGTALLVAVVGPVAIAAARLVAAALPGARRPEAALAQCVVTLAVVLGVVELLGTVGAMRRGWLVAGCVVAALLVGLAARRLAGSQARPAADAARNAPLNDSTPLTRLQAVPLAAAVAAASLVVFQWGSRTVEVLGRGMADPDTLWYHMPFAARFAQDGWTTRLHFVQDEPSTAFHPASSELLHGIGIALYGGFDVLSPWINLGFAALTLLAAWCLGSRWGAGPLAVVAAALVLVLPIMSETQPGEAANDAAGLAFFLAAAALLAGRAADGRGRLALAGAAAGLAAASKLSLLAPAFALTLVAIAAAERGRRRGAALAWALPLAATGSFWYLRNLARTGNPLPWSGLGPLGLPSPPLPLTDKVSFSVLHYLDEPDIWRESFTGQLNAAFSACWPLVLLLAAAGAVIAVARPRDRLQPLLGAAGVFSAAAYLATPASAAGPDGFPVLFGLNTRFLTPALALALVLLAAAKPLASARAQAAAGLALLILVALTQAAADPWPPGWAVAVGAALAVLTALGAAAAVAPRRPPIPKRPLAIAAAAALLVAGWPVQDAYFDERYASLGPTLPQPSLWARDVHDQRVGIVGYLLQYPLYGIDDSNPVEYVGVPGAHGAFARAPDCQTFRRIVRERRLRYVVTAPVGSVVLGPVAEGSGEPREAGWLRSLRSAREVMREPALNTAVFRVDGPVDERGCAAPLASAAR